jgi:AcrR family transcriptional regulator
MLCNLFILHKTTLTTVPSGRYSSDMTKRTRQHILTVASQIVQRDGVAHLTIDAVAREAKLSKGGVLYHFPSKDALVGGMVMDHIENFTHDLTTHQAEENGPGGWLRAYLRASDDTVQKEPDPVVCLIAAIATNPALLAPLQEHFALWQEQAVQDGIDPALATIIRLAVDGLWFADLFQLGSPQGELRKEVLRLLHSMAHPPSDTP